jgi:DNA anti-recombination protein RmuC
VPVTAKLSRRFYEAFGDDIASELVDWFNAVDLTYRGDLRELNELNFARFDAKLEQRIAHLESTIEQRFARMESTVEQRFAQTESKFERRTAETESKFERRIADTESKFEQRLSQLDSKAEQRFAQLEAKIATTKSDVIKWSFAFWIGTVVTIFLARQV